MSTMLADGNLHEKLAKLRATDKGLVNKIKQFFAKMIAKFQAYYKGLDPEQKDARDVRAMKDSFDRIQQAFAEALVEASDNFQAATEQKNTTEDGGEKMSIRENVVDVNGRVYDQVVELEYSVFKKVSRRGSIYIDFIRNNLINKKITVFNEDGEVEVIEFAKVNERVRKDGSSSFKRVLGELEQARDSIKKLVVVNAEETTLISRIANGDINENSHQWLDANGWDERESYVLTDDGIIYPVTVFIAKTRDGRNILYDVNVKKLEGVAIDKVATSQYGQAVKVATPSNEGTVAQIGDGVKKILTTIPSGLAMLFLTAPCWRMLLRDFRRTAMSMR